MKQRVKLWLPVDIVEWLKGHPGDEHRAAEKLLREAMNAEKQMLARLRKYRQASVT